MSAGIVSACLPTLLPIALVFLRCCGSKRAADSLPADSDVPLTFGGSGGKRSKGSKGSNRTPRKMDSTLRTQDDSRGGTMDASSFYRLPDDTESGSIVSARVKPDDEAATTTYLDTKLRPDVQEYGLTARGFTAGTEDVDKDDIPLRAIRVQTEFKQSSHRASGRK